MLHARALVCVYGSNSKNKHRSWIQMTRLDFGISRAKKQHTSQGIWNEGREVWLMAGYWFQPLAGVKKKKKVWSKGWKAFEKDNNGSKMFCLLVLGVHKHL